MQGFVGGIGHHESKRLYDKCASTPRLHGWLHVLGEEIQRSFANGIKVKAPENEDTLLRTHCFSWCFLGCANWETFVADTKCFWTKSETFFVSRTQNCVRNKCCARGQTGKHLCRQQCVRNNVSSFARAFSNRTAVSDIYSELSTYAEDSKVRVSLCILLKEN